MPYFQKIVFQHSCGYVLYQLKFPILFKMQPHKDYIIVIQTNFKQTMFYCSDIYLFKQAYSKTSKNIPTNILPASPMKPRNSRASSDLLIQNRLNICAQKLAVKLIYNLFSPRSMILLLCSIYNFFFCWIRSGEHKLEAVMALRS